MGTTKAPSTIIGLTGGMASGKNQVASMLAERGAVVIDADQVSRDLVAPGSPLLSRLVQTWGVDILDASGGLDRRALGARVFGRAEEVARLNALTHPAILGEIARRLDEAEAPVRVVMAPLLLEAGADALVGEVWVVHADLETRVRRVMQRDALSDQQARQRIFAQMSDEERLRGADVVLVNDGDLESLRAQVQQQWERLESMRASDGGSNKEP